MKVKTHIKAGQIAIAIIGQATGEGNNDNRGGAIGILNNVG
jgi:hypothetical protein